MDILNNRELASIIWLSAFVLWACIHKNIRTNIGGIFKTLYSAPFITVFIFCSTYVIAIVLVFYSFDLWHIEQLKSTLIWFFSVALFSIGVAEKAKSSSYLLQHLVTNNFKIIVLIEFIINFYPLSIIAELILFPIVITLVAVSAYAENKEEHSQVKKLFDYALSGLGVYLILRALYQLINNFNEFAQLSTLADFSLAPLLSLLYLPFIYFLYLYIKYENVFLRLHYFIKDKKLQSYTKLYALKAFHINVHHLNEWARCLAWHETKTKKDIKSSIILYKKLLQRAKSPEHVKKKHGWSPFKATCFLKKHGITTNLYHPTVDNEWFASSEYIKMTDTFRSNQVAYYISGNEQAATKLKLSFHIHEKENNEEETIEWIQSLITTLLKKAKIPLNKSLEQKNLVVGKTLTFKYSKVTLREEKYEHLKDEQYIHLEIVHKKMSSKREITQE